jgi:hypothetical protein
MIGLGCGARGGVGQKADSADDIATADTASDTDTSTDTDSDADTDTDTDADTDADTDTDTDTDVDTEPGRATGFYEWEVTQVAGVFVAGTSGMRWRNAAGDLICEASGPLTDLGYVPAGCPDCTWSFGLELGTVSWDGDHCDTLDYRSWVSGWMDRTNAYGQTEYWGYEPYYLSSSGVANYSQLWSYSFGSWVERFSNRPSLAYYAVIISGDTVSWHNISYDYGYYTYTP